MILEKPRAEDQKYFDLMVEELSALVEYRLGRDELGNIVIFENNAENKDPLSISEYMEVELTGEWSYLLNKYKELESFLIILSFGDQKDDPMIQLDTGSGKMAFRRGNTYSTIPLPDSLVQKLDNWAEEEIRSTLI